VNVVGAKFPRAVRVLLAAALPLVALGLWTARHAWFTSSGTLVEFPVVGYDPRDLLTGHYVTYRVDYGVDKLCDNGGAGSDRESCLCLVYEGDGPRVRVDGASACGEMPSQLCTAVLKGYCDGSRFVAGIERYHFPEEHAAELAVVPPHATIQVRVGSNRKGIVTAMHVDGMPVLDWARQKRLEKSDGQP
jgi:uncharacterized membrane-anchored protein